MSILPEVGTWGQAPGRLACTSMVCIYVEVRVCTYVGCVLYVDKYVYACVFDVYIPIVCECMYMWDAL